MMIDLNHRYALDGSDANSYGGLLWCLGLFDRPFKPGRPVIGTLRPRSTSDHARRLDLAAYQAKIKSPASGGPLKVAVIGAGISGLFVARTLSDQGHQVVLFEKSGQPGGRVATVVSGNHAYDAGAQYFTAHDDRFDRYVQSWQMDGIVKLWKGRLGVLKEGDFSPQRSPTRRWVGTPGMQAVAHHLAAGLDIRFRTKMVAANRNGKGWQLTDAGRHRSEVYDVIVAATPPPPAIDFVRQSARLSDQMAGIEMQPCLAVMVAFERSLDLPFDGVFIRDAPIRWACRNSSKPQRPKMECWVLHAGPEWSRQHAGTDIEKVTRRLLTDFFNRVGRRPVEPADAAVRYWASASTANPLSAGCLWDDDLLIGVCGDWCRMSRLEDAALSGMAMAGRVMGIESGPRYNKGVQRDVWPR
jgi:predicted NAD/FAD-dependent oxidoreductase